MGTHYKKKQRTVSSGMHYQPQAALESFFGNAHNNLVQTPHSNSDELLELQGIAGTGSACTICGVYV